MKFSPPVPLAVLGLRSPGASAEAAQAAARAGPPGPPEAKPGPKRGGPGGPGGAGGPMLKLLTPEQAGLVRAWIDPAVK